MLVGANHGAVDVMEGPVERALGVGVLLEVRQDAVPDPSPSPAIEAGGNGLPGTIPLRQIPLGRTGAIEPQQAVDEAAIVLRWAASLSLLRWKQRPQPLPLLVGQISSAHTLESTRLDVSCKRDPRLRQKSVCGRITSTQAADRLPTCWRVRPLTYPGPQSAPCIAI